MSKTEEQHLNDLIKQLSAANVPDFGKLLVPPVPAPPKLNTDLEMYRAKMDAYAASVKSHWPEVKKPMRASPTNVVSIDDAVRLRNEMLISGVWVALLRPYQLECTARVHTRIGQDKAGRLVPLDDIRTHMLGAWTVRSIGLFYEQEGGRPMLEVPFNIEMPDSGSEQHFTFDVGFPQ